MPNKKKIDSILYSLYSFEKNAFLYNIAYLWEENENVKML